MPWVPRVVAPAALLAVLSAPAAAQRGPVTRPTGLPPDVLALACAPVVTFERPRVALRVTGGQDSFARRIYGPGDLVTISAGAGAGIEAGQDFAVRRLRLARGQRIDGRTAATIQTSGWIRVYAVDDDLSLATVTHACDTIEVGDFLEPLELPAPPAPIAATSGPDRGNYGVVMRGSDGRRSFGQRDFFVVDRGASHGVAPGTSIVIYRNTGEPDNFLFELGEAMAVDVRPTTSTVRVLRAHDAIAEGDWVAVRR